MHRFVNAAISTFPDLILDLVLFQELFVSECLLYEIGVFKVNVTNGRYITCAVVEGRLYTTHHKRSFGVTTHYFGLYYFRDLKQPYVLSAVEPCATQFIVKLNFWLFLVLFIIYLYLRPNFVANFTLSSSIRHATIVGTKIPLTNPLKYADCTCTLHHYLILDKGFLLGPFKKVGTGKTSLFPSCGCVTTTLFLT